MKSIRCVICGYIYDPETGMSRHDGIEPGTAFQRSS
ncbi:MAG: rubredoxin [Ignavibacteriales bacterium]|nr:rubredoxin [Ignavibacteriales bacterium]